MSDTENELVDEIGKYATDPLGYTNFAYQWNEKELKESGGPRAWQKDILKTIGDKLKNPKTRFEPILIAIASGHGIGKSALISQVIMWGMSTCEDCKIVVTANTDTQLRTKTFPEVTKWHRLSINKHWFEATATSLYAKTKDHEKAWRADAIPWSVSNTEAFAGLHNIHKRIIVVFDEASSIDDRIWNVVEGALTDEQTEIIWLAFGNPTRNIGRFRECFRRYKHRWLTMQIDSRTIEGTNKVQLQKWVDDYGEDSDFVKVRVRGVFPSTSFKQFISTEDVDAAFGRQIKEHQYSFAPKILTVDPAFEGDDELAIGLRQGLVFKILQIIPKNDNDVHVANLVARLEDEEKADAVFVDGGYGTGIVSVGRTLNRNWQLVWFGGKANNEGYLNKRSEMWGEIKQWLKDGGCIPKDNTLYSDLISPETVARLDGKIQLESKKDMKTRGVPSPNRADALALSFAMPVRSKDQMSSHKTNQHHKSDYDPYKE